MRFIKKWAVGAAVLSMVLTGCSKDAAVTGDSPQGPRPLTIALPTEIKSMDLYAHNDFVSWMAAANLYNGLLKRSPKGEIVNDLADSYTKINDTTWEFTLKKGVKFHDGNELTAEDVKFTLERATKDKTLNEGTAFKSIAEVKVLEPHKLQVLTQKPDPLLLSVVARTSAVIYPKKYIEEKGADYFNEHPVGTGPYKFVEWKRGSHVTMEPYADYFEGAAKDWSKLTFRIVPEATTRVGELLTGGVDLIPGVASNDWPRIKGNATTELVSANSNRVAIIVPKAAPGTPTADKRVREAIELAIDKKLIIDKLLGGDASQTRTRVTPGSFGANEKLFNTSLTDVEKAKQLLKDAGYANGLQLTMQSSNGRYAKDKEVAEMVVGMLAAVGIQVKLELMEWNSYLELRNANKVGDLHMVWFANSFYDAHIMIGEHLTGSRSMEKLGYTNPQLKEILTKAESNMNETERAALYKQAQEIEAEERMRIYLYLEHNTYGVNKAVSFQPRLDEMIKAYEIKRK
ncbi:peptide/nickel transport system substrate-binding protein [Paenibacillus sp. UNCCL117]|uniref:ABC transporter substrate-binding protein n=1 Tax=unclassified Paenibacillus TaxID=185978 RepID=UPI0008904F7D|nr:MULTISPECIES: ABC transporter substrate-binding protein [unclassified Paenibacillus]SDD79451.1 peptide/nickel transport system substrate-binding protein [Paenibacillus sp. cl123]SFW53203.1 peptide/nickel transport system substrate-binding protein [Paenibacillus sp. UNCCL117]